MPEAETFVTVTLAEIDLASAGTPQVDATMKDRSAVPDAWIAGLPATVRVSKRRQGVMT
jgi:hypothetical protein